MRLSLYFHLCGCFIFMCSAIALLGCFFSSIGTFFYAFFPLWTDSLSKGEVWRLVSYLFIHAPLIGVGTLHIIFNMLTLSMFGSEVEKWFGSLRFGIVYVSCGIFAALTFLVEQSLRNPAGTPEAMIGASGAIMGILASFAVLHPHAEVFLLFFPFPIKIQKALVIIIIASVICMFIPPLAFIGHSAHIGGAVAGYLYALWWKKRYGKPHMWRVDNTILDDRDITKERVETLLRKFESGGWASLNKEEIWLIRELLQRER